jgi:hypothetical protein
MSNNLACFSRKISSFFFDRLLIVLVLLLVFGCQPDTIELPVSVEKAATIITDVHTAEAAILPLYGLRKDSFAAMYYDQICQIHQIDSTTLVALIKIVRNNPEIMGEIYSEAFREIEAQEAEND